MFHGHVSGGELLSRGHGVSEEVNEWAGVVEYHTKPSVKSPSSKYLILAVTERFGFQLCSAVQCMMNGRMKRRRRYV